MTPRAYYSENDRFAAQWLRELIILGEIADGDVDERSIVDVTPGDLRGYTQCHFFAGIGGWSHALRLAGWGDDQPVWTGSCPCQPFSAAGQQKGFDDPRHLWPVWSRLLRECRPSVVFGEQVASQLSWLDLVCGDLEAEGYAVGAAIIGAHSVGAPHIRQRLYFVADTENQRHKRCGRARCGWKRFEDDGAIGHLADPDDTGSQRRRRDELPERAGQFVAGAGGASGELEHAESDGRIKRRAEPGGRGVASGCESSELGDTASGCVSNQRVRNGSSGQHVLDVARATSRSGSGDRAERNCGSAAGDADAARLCSVADPNGRESSDRGLQRSGEHDQRPEDTALGFWSACDWLPCLDGKLRPVEPGTFPLVAGLPGRVGRLRGYGNSIVAPCAATFIRSYLETRRS